MKPSRGERRASICLVPVVLWFFPPVTTWAASVETRVLGLPFLVFWSALGAAMSAFWMTLALRLYERGHR